MKKNRKKDISKKKMEVFDNTITLNQDGKLKVMFFIDKKTVDKVELGDMIIIKKNVENKRTGISIIPDRYIAQIKSIQEYYDDKLKINIFRVEAIAILSDT